MSVFSQPQKTILLTGAAGEIGTSLRQQLQNQYQFRCFDRVRTRNAKDVRVADIRNFKAVLKAMKGVDAVIHLAANRDCDQPWSEVLTHGIEGTQTVFEAARQAGVKHILYASTIHVSGWREIEQASPITPDQLIRPDSLYAVGKSFGEAFGQYFVDRYTMTVICLRIGAFKSNPQLYSLDDPLLAAWCSPRDLAQLVMRSLEHKDLWFQIFYAVSGNTRCRWDISNARSILGYEPEDNAENLLQDYNFS